jgi:hypothetical protein
LGDLHIQKQTPNSNVYCQFAQGLIHEEYLFHLFDLFKDYCITEPKIKEDKPDFRTNKVYSSVHFNTIRLPCFNELYLLFYLNRKKVVPLNIRDLLTPAGLAFLAQDDGSLASRRNGFYFSTNSFTLSEVELLASVLKDKFNLDCTIQKEKSKHRIYIRAKSLPLFRELVTPYFHFSMIYKLNIREKLQK